MNHTFGTYIHTCKPTNSRSRKLRFKWQSGISDYSTLSVCSKDRY